MRLASFAVDGRDSFGLVTDGGIVDLGLRCADRYATLRDALVGGGLDEMRQYAVQAPDRELGAVTFLPVIPNPDKILCVGLNYKSHVDETGRELPANPSVFARLTNTLIGHGMPMRRPRVSERFDYEGELALIIGKGGRHIAEAEALNHVAGYTCFVDGSVRDYQKVSVTAGKNFPDSGPLGPWLVTTDEIPDPTSLHLTTRLNGEVVQEAGTDLLIYSVPKIIAWCSSFTPLEPGDVIATGTPKGVGARREPPLWMKAGDRLEVEISGIGTLANLVADEA